LGGLGGCCCVTEGIAAREVALGHSRLAGMPLAQQELGALALEAALEEVGAELQDVGGLLLANLAVEGADLVDVVGWQRHGRRERRGMGFSDVT
jgi:hypothetical protein